MINLELCAYNRWLSNAIEKAPVLSTGASVVKNGPVGRKTADPSQKSSLSNQGSKLYSILFPYPRSEAPKSKAIPSRPNPWPMMAVSHTAVSKRRMDTTA